MKKSNSKIVTFPNGASMPTENKPVTTGNVPIHNVWDETDLSNADYYQFQQVILNRVPTNIKQMMIADILTNAEFIQSRELTYDTSITIEMKLPSDSHTTKIPIKINLKIPRYI